MAALVLTTVRTADGWTLALEVRAAPDPCGVVLMLHAMMVDRRTLDRPDGAGLASTLVDAGLTVVLADYRGHGASGPAASRVVDWCYDDLVWRDTPALFAEAERVAGGLPWFALGHSLGTHVSLAAVASGAAQAPRAFALVAPNIWLPHFEPSWTRARLKSALGRGLSASGRVFGHFPTRWYRLGPTDESKTYMADFRRFWREDRWGSRGGLDYHARLDRIREPALVISGEGDRLYAPRGDVERFTRPLVGRELCHVGPHDLGYAPGHMELVTDRRSAPLWRRIAGWITARCRR